MNEKKFSDFEIHKINFILNNNAIHNTSCNNLESFIKTKIDSISPNIDNIRDLKIFKASESDSDFIVKNYLENEEYTFDNNEYKNFKFFETTFDEISSNNFNGPKNQVVHVEFKQIPDLLINAEKIFENFDINIDLKNDLNQKILSIKFNKEFDLLKEDVDLESYSGFSGEEILDFFEKLYTKKESFKYDINLKLDNNFYKSDFHSNGYCNFKNDLIIINDLYIKVFDKDNNVYKMESNVKNYELILDDFFSDDLDEKFTEYKDILYFVDLNSHQTLDSSFMRTCYAGESVV